MTITERIAAAIKPILDEDRRADRERIAELERDLAALRARLLGGSDEEELSKVSYNAYIDVFSGEIDRLTEKCAALVVERDRLAIENAGLHKQCDDLQRSMGRATPLRIDTDMSDPQPGKLLVVRVAEWDIHSLRLPFKSLSFFTTQFVGFLVETPAVEVKRTPKVGDRVRLTVSGWEGETAKIVDVKEQSAALALDEVGVDVKRFSFDCFEVIE